MALKKRRQTKKMTMKSRKKLRKSRKKTQKGGYVLFRAQVGEPVASDEVKHEWAE